MKEKLCNSCGNSHPLDMFKSELYVEDYDDCVWCRIKEEEQDRKHLNKEYQRDKGVY